MGQAARSAVSFDSVSVLSNALTMLRSRSTGIVFLVAALALFAAGSAHARVLSPNTVPKRLIFPVVGSSHFTNDFGAPRPQGSHQGNDIIGPWRSPVVAVESGTVTLWTASARAGCMLWLNGDSGTRYAYIHLNNDLTSKNDNRGGCLPGIAYAPTLADGQRVKAGELIGFNGDSGDANGGVYHVHFELQERSGVSITPYRWLLKARPLLYPVVKHVGPEGIGFKLQGTIVATRESAEGVHLVVKSSFLRATDGSKYDVDRKVFFTINADTRVLAKKGRKRKVSKLVVAKPGRRVTVWTLPVQPTVDTALGKRGALTASRVLVAR
jgi:hypothetical protein